jgi:nucleoside-diphosphate-sugar epimerase
MTIRELADKIVDTALEVGLLDEPCPVRPHAFHYSQSFDDTWSRVPDITRSKDLLGFSPSVSLSDGLKVTLTYYRDLSGGSGTARAAANSVSGSAACTS